MDPRLIDLEKLRVRFEPKYIPEPNSGCWLWLAALNKDDYGQIWSGLRNERGTALQMGAHRASIILAHGPEALVGDVEVCHRCDNPPCVNPDHLFVAPHVKNVHDAMSKGRFARGERVGTSILSKEEVKAIAAAHGTNVEIALVHGVHRNTVALIRCGKSWSHLTGISPHNRKTRMEAAA
jgi:hypothetical protein